MKIKNIQIIKANKAIETLIGMKLPLKVKTNYKLAKISLAVRSEANVLEMTQKQIAAKYAKEGVTFGPELPEFQLFFQEWKEVADMEVDLAADKIKLEEIDLDGVVIPIDLLRDLAPFIEQ